MKHRRGPTTRRASAKSWRNSLSKVSCQSRLTGKLSGTAELLLEIKETRLKYLFLA